MKGGPCIVRLSPMAFGFALGVTSGLWMLLFAWSVMWWGHGTLMVAQWAEVLPGYSATIKGGLIGGGWGFLEGFVGGLIFGWCYNLCKTCCACLCCKPGTEVKETKNKKS